jgi:dTDP-4-amino-4,6-dideoxygalactose transaminase
LPGISLINYDPAERINYQYVVLEVDPDLCPRNRDEIVEALHLQNIIARKYFWPGCHRMEPYRSLQPNAGLLLEKTEAISARVIVLPTGQMVDVDTINFICNVIRKVLKSEN